MGLLDDLKKEADFLKNKEAARTQSLNANAASVDRALRKAFHYLDELFRQLNVVKPTCDRTYDLPGVGTIAGLAQFDYRIEYRTSQRNNAEHFEYLEVNFKRSKGEQLTVKREAEQIERFRELLWLNNLRFTSEPIRNERRVAVSETFVINGDIICGVDIVGDYETGAIRFKLKNVEDFGPTMYTLEPDAVTDQAIEELAKLLIGKDSTFKAFNRFPVRSAAAGPALPRGSREPQYVTEPPPMQAAEEKKGGLFGSLKAVFRK